MSSSTSLTAFWPPVFVSAKPSQTLLLIDRSEPRFKSQTGGKIRKTLKNDENFDVFINFRLNQLFRPDQENERQDI